MAITTPSSQVDAAIAAKLANDATLAALATEGVWYGAADQGVACPFVVYAPQTPGTHRYTFGDNRYAIDYLYTVKGVTEGLASLVGAQIDARIDAVLHSANLSISGYGTMICRRVSDVRYHEVDQGRTYAHRGGVYAISING
jgi:hypothetical protein